MSDLFEVEGKTMEGASWRGTIRINMDGEEKELCVRQLYDHEFKKVMGKVNRNELRELREKLPSEEMSEYQELQDKEELDEDESKRLEELEEILNNSDANIFDILSDETFEGIQLAAKLGIEPDDKDLRNALVNFAEEIEDDYGHTVRTKEDCYDFCKDKVVNMIEKSTGFQSFTMGIQVIFETVGDEGK